MFIGINKFERLLVYGTGTTEEDKRTVIEKVKEKIDGIIEKIAVKESMLDLFNAIEGYHAIQAYLRKTSNTIAEGISLIT